MSRQKTVAPDIDENSVQLSIMISDKLRRKAKIAASYRDKTLGQVIRELVNEYVREFEKERGRELEV